MCLSKLKSCRTLSYRETAYVMYSRWLDIEAATLHSKIDYLPQDASTSVAEE